MYDFLSPKGQRVWMFYERGLREGLSFNEIIRIVREAGLGYRRTEMLADLRKMAAYLGRWDWLQRRPRHLQIPEEAFAPTRTPTPQPYMVTVEGEVFNPYTGEREVVYYSLGYPDRPSVEQALEDARMAFNLRASIGETDWIFTPRRVVKCYGWRG